MKSQDIGLLLKLVCLQSNYQQLDGACPRCDQELERYFWITVQGHHDRGR